MFWLLAAGCSGAWVLRGTLTRRSYPGLHGGFDCHDRRRAWPGSLSRSLGPLRAARGRRSPSSGEAAEGTAIYRFQVLLHPDGAPEIRLNDQIGGAVQATATRAVAAGEVVTTDDFSAVKSYEPMPEDADVPHITAFAHRGGWSISFDFTYRHPRRFDHLSAGRDFAATAREALAAGRVGAALENAHSAVELLAKAELLSCRPTIDEAISARSHGGRDTV